MPAGGLGPVRVNVVSLGDRLTGLDLTTGAGHGVDSAYEGLDMFVSFREEDVLVPVGGREFTLSSHGLKALLVQSPGSATPVRLPYGSRLTYELDVEVTCYPPDSWKEKQVPVRGRGTTVFGE